MSTKARLLEGFAKQPELNRAKRIWVGFSAGLDSTVLLDVAVRWCRNQGIDVAALHVNHGLQPAACDFVLCAQRVAERLNIPLSIKRVQVEDQGLGPAGNARAARYTAFQDTLTSGEWLLLAHHKQDQLETLLLQFLRGVGVHAKLGMPNYRRLAAGHLFRPLLDIEHDDIVAYAKMAELDWIEDPSNASSGYERNRVRRHLIPVLDQHWPDYPERLAGGAAKMDETSQLLEEIATGDLAAIEMPDLQLNAAALRSLSPLRGKNLFYVWLTKQGCALPSETEYQALAQQIDHADSCNFSWDGGMIKAYRGRLRLFRGPPPPAPSTTSEWSSGVGEIQLPTGHLSLRTAPSGDARSHNAPLLAAHLAPFKIRFGQPKVSFCWRGVNRSLKKIYQELGVIDVSRPLLPLIFSGDELKAIADLCVADDAKPTAGEDGLKLRWQAANDYAACINPAQ